MFKGKLDRIPDLNGGHFKVIQLPGPSTTGLVDESRPAAGVNHTTESRYLPSFTRGYPHLSVGQPGAGRRSVIGQCIYFGQYGTALANDSGGIETNRWVRCQIEIVGYSSLEPWLPVDPEQRAQLAAVYEWCEKELGIPERRPFPDAMTEKLKPGVYWATSRNPRRLSGKFGKQAGWFNHLEVPENDHWDAGAMKTRVLLREEPERDMVKRWMLKAVWKEDGHREHRELTGHMTLKQLGSKIASDRTLRQAIKRQRARGHRIVMVDHLVPSV